jgi:hypothetical protein
VVTRLPPRIAAPTTADAEVDMREELLKDLEPVPPLKNPQTYVAPDGETWTKYDNGIMIQEIRKGIEGMVPRLGQTVSVAYVGTLPGSNIEFDRSKEGAPLTFKFGSKGLIKGFNVGVSTMNMTGKRRVWVPADLAYGAYGSPPKIGSNQDLIFQLELLSISGQAVEFPAATTKEGIMGPPATGPAASASASAPATGK